MNACSGIGFESTYAHEIEKFQFLCHGGRKCFWTKEMLLLDNDGTTQRSADAEVMSDLAS